MGSRAIANGWPLLSGRAGPVSSYSPAFGAALDLNFAQGYYFKNGLALPINNIITASGGDNGWIDDLSGNWFQTAAPRVSNKGLLVEEARTNYVRNSALLGAVAGSPGTAPTNTALRSVQSGVVNSVALSAMELGLETFEFSAVGTAPGINTHYFQFDASNTACPATVGQTFAASIFAKALSTVGVTQVQFNYIEYAADGTTVLSGVGTSNVTVSSLALSKVQGSYTITNASTAYLVVRLNVVYGTGTVNLAYRLARPQLEQGAFATSPIRTTTVAVSRSADVCTSAIPGTLSAATLVGTFQTLALGANQENVIAIGDGTTSNRIQVARTTSTVVQAFETTSGSSASVNASSAFADLTRSAVAAAVAANDRAISLNGGTIATDATTLGFPPVSTMYLGAHVAGGNASLNGYLERAILFPTRRTNTDLQILSNLANY